MNLSGIRTSNRDLHGQASSSTKSAGTGHLSSPITGAPPTLPRLPLLFAGQLTHSYVLYAAILYIVHRVVDGTSKSPQPHITRCSKGQSSYSRSTRRGTKAPHMSSTCCAHITTRSTSQNRLSNAGGLTAVPDFSKITPISRANVRGRSTPRDQESQPHPPADGSGALGAEQV